MIIFIKCMPYARIRCQPIFFCWFVMPGAYPSPLGWGSSAFFCFFLPFSAAIANPSGTAAFPRLFVPVLGPEPGIPTHHKGFHWVTGCSQGQWSRWSWNSGAEIAPTSFLTSISELGRPSLWVYGNEMNNYTGCWVLYRLQTLEPWQVWQSVGVRTAGQPTFGKWWLSEYRRHGGVWENWNFER